MTAREVADDYLRDLADLSPQAADVLGREVLQVPDLSPEAFEQRAALDARILARLDAVAPAAARATTSTAEPTSDAGEAVEQPARDADAVLAAALRERLTSDLALDEVGFTRSLLAPLATPVHLVRQVFDDLPRDTDDDWARVAEHLAAVPTALTQYLATLEESAARGHVRARRQVLGVAAQCDGWVANRFYPGLVEGHDGPLAGELSARAEAAADATSRFAADLRERLLPLAGSDDAVGRETYEVTSTAFLGAAVDLDELYDWGWQELRRLDSLARALAEQIAGVPDVGAAAAMLDADATRRVAVGAPLEQWLQGRLDALTDTLDGRWFDLPARGRAVEAHLTTSAAGVMYYTPGDAAGTRPGRVWWTVPPGSETVATWDAVSTVHHEGLPGHHLQHAVTAGLEHLHPWQRHLCHVHGYAEGWAHYAEHLALEIGLLEDPGERLGMLLARIWRACRVVVDIGLHLDLPVPPGNGFVDASRWTPELGVDLLRRVARVDPTTATFEVDRYLGWPGQALAFTVGSRLWQQTREAAERAEGEAFDLKGFHMAALGLGPMGLGPLRGLLTATAVDSV